MTSPLRATRPAPRTKLDPTRPGGQHTLLLFTPSTLPMNISSVLHNAKQTFDEAALAATQPGSTADQHEQDKRKHVRPPRPPSPLRRLCSRASLPRTARNGTDSARRTPPRAR